MIDTILTTILMLLAIFLTWRVASNPLNKEAARMREINDDMQKLKDDMQIVLRLIGGLPTKFKNEDLTRKPDTLE